MNGLLRRSDVFVFYSLAYLQSQIEWIEQSKNRSTGYLIGRFILLHMKSSPPGLKIWPYIIGHTELKSNHLLSEMKKSSSTTRTRLV